MQDIVERTRLVDVRQQSIENVRRALRQQKSSILSYFGNFTVSTEERSYYQELAEVMTKCCCVSTRLCI